MMQRASDDEKPIDEAAWTVLVHQIGDRIGIPRYDGYRYAFNHRKQEITGSLVLRRDIYLHIELAVFYWNPGEAQINAKLDTQWNPDHHRFKYETRIPLGVPIGQIVDQLTDQLIIPSTTAEFAKLALQNKQRIEADKATVAGMAAILQEKFPKMLVYGDSGGIITATGRVEWPEIGLKADIEPSGIKITKLDGHTLPLDAFIRFIRAHARALKQGSRR